MKLGGNDISTVKLGASQVQAIYSGTDLVWQNAPVATAATGIGQTSFTANWEAYTGAVYYLLDVSESSDFSTFIYENQVVTSTSYVVIGLNPNTTYYYRVRASTEPLYLLDDWQYPDAAAAYSLRKLNSSYTGSAIEVRNDSGVHLDIGFDSNGDLNTATLLTHCGSGNGTVSKWYDQSGNGIDATQGTVANQPEIVSSGSVVTENGEPSLSFDGTDDYLFTGSVLDVNGLSNLYFFTVVQTDNTAYSGNSNKAIFWMAETGSWGQIHNSLTQTQVAFRFGTGQSGNEQSTTITSSASMRLVSLYKNNTVDRVDVNGNNEINYTSALGTIANTSNVLNIGKGFVQYMPMNLSELIFYPSDQSSNRTGIETNINANYNMYWGGSQTSLLDTYSGSAAAYSLRALNSAYTGPLVRVRRATGGEQDIYAKYDGSLNVDALESFCSGTDGFVTTWYDQSGNGNDATQTTAANQPQIVSSGSVILENGKPAMTFVDLNDYWQFSSNFSTFNNTSIFNVIAPSNYGAGAQNARFYDLYDGTYHIQYLRDSSTQLLHTKNTLWQSGNNATQYTTQNTPTSQFLSSVFALSSSNDLYFDSALQSKTSSSNVGSAGSISVIGQRADIVNSTNFFGNYQELIIYQSDQSSNRTGIETNINDFYSIYYAPSDADAQAFVSRVETAGGSLSDTEKEAVNTLVLQMKADGIWTKMKAIYPMVGASAAACAQNLKSSSFTGTFTSGWTFASTGITPTSAYMDTNLSSNTSLSLNDLSLNIYSRTDSSTGGILEIKI